MAVHCRMRHVAWLFLCAFPLLLSLWTPVSAQDGVAATAVATSGGSLEVNWVVMDLDVREDVVSFDVRVNEALVATDLTATVSSFRVYNLRANTQQSVVVIAKYLNDSVYLPLESNEVLVATPDATPPDAMAAPVLVSIGGGFASVNLTMPLDLGGAAIKSTTLKAFSFLDLTTKTVTVALASANMTIYGLGAGTTYRITAFVTNAADLAAHDSLDLVVTTREVQPPGDCPPPTVLNATGGSITLKLNPPSDDGGAPIRSYIVFVSVNGTSTFQEVATTTYPDIDVIKILRLPGNVPLLAQARYDFKALATNMADVCAAPTALTGAQPVTAWTTQPSLPDAPPAPYFLTATGGLIMIEVIAPTSMNGAALRQFQIKANSSMVGSVDVTSSDSAIVYSITNLVASSTYKIQVAAVTNIGTTAWSDGINMYTEPVSAPTSPLDLTVIDIEASKAKVQWSPPQDNGGAAITAYHVSLTTGAKTTTATTSDTTFALTNLLAKTVYSVRVVATNAAGRSSSASTRAAVSFETAIATVPSEPEEIDSVAITGGSIEVQWSFPAETGGASASSMIYNATIFLLGNCFNTEDVNPCSDCLLVSQGDDTFDWVESSDDCIQPAVCPDGSRSCCVASSTSAFGNGQLCSTISSTGVSNIVVGVLSTTFFGLSHSTVYYVAVKVINHVGSSSFSSVVGLTTAAQTAPSFPVNLRVIGGTGGSVVLAWDPPQDSGGATIVGYMVYRDYALLTQQPVQAPYTDCGGILASTNYLYGAAAVHASGEIGSLSTVSVTTQSLSTPLPPAVQSISRTVNSLNITIVPSCDTGGARFASYQQQLLLDSTTAVASSYFGCCNLVITGLASNQQYSVLIRAASDAGQSDWVRTSVATSDGVPDTPRFRLNRPNTYSLSLEMLNPVVPDNEIKQYDILAFGPSGAVVFEDHPLCTVTPPGNVWVCPQYYTVRLLAKTTTYKVAIRARGPNGASDWANQTLRTTDEVPGRFELLNQDYSATSGGIINVTVHRVGGTAGQLQVGLNVFDPATVVLRCDCTPLVGCTCRLNLASSKATPQPAAMTFDDGQMYQNVLISVWEDDPSVLQPMTIVVKLVGSSTILSGQYQALLRIGLSQRNGVLSFTESRTVVMENATFVEVQLARLNGTSGLIQYDIETFDITAKGSRHYVGIHKSLVLTSRQSSTYVWIKIINDNFYEGTRSFGVRLMDTSGAGHPNMLITREVIIYDDDPPSRQVPTAPINVEATDITGGEVDIQWQDPPNSAPLGYLVRAVKASALDFFSLYNVTSSPFTVASLSSRTAYVVDVAAWNEWGIGDFSVRVSFTTTDYTPPSEPEDFTSPDIGSSFVRLTWDEPRDLGGGTLSSYLLWMVSDDGTEKVLSNSTSAITDWTEYELNASTVYSFFVSAGTDRFPASLNGRAASLEVETNSPVVPGKPPAIILLAPPTAGTITVQVPLPHENGGVPIEDFHVYLRRVRDPIEDDDNNNFPTPGPLQEVCNYTVSDPVDGAERSCIIYKLLMDSYYELYATLDNEVGTSEDGEKVVFHTGMSLNLPTPPLNFKAATVTAGNIYLSWDMPLDLGGTADVIGYVVFQKIDVLSDQYFVVYDGQDSAERSTVIKRLNRNYLYSFAIVALNPSSFCVNPDAREMSQFVNVQTLPSSRVTPPETLFLLTATGGSITFGWTQPKDFAGLSLDGYLVFRVLLNGTRVLLSESMLPASIEQFTDVGLKKESKYLYEVVAVNQETSSDYSPVFEGYTSAATAPSAVRNLQLVAATGGSLTLTWDPPLDTGGIPIDHYEVVRQGSNNPYHPNETTFTDDQNLVAGTSYTYQIRAYNGQMYGPPLFTRETTTDPTQSDPPVFDSFQPHGGRLLVAWREPQNTGGAPVLGYVIQIQDEKGNNVGSYAGNATSTTFWGLTASTKYIVIRSLVTVAGQSKTAQDDIVTDIPEVPGSPPPPSVLYVAGGSVQLSVLPTNYTGGESVTMRLYRDHDGTLVHVFDPAETTTTVYGLFAETTYEFYSSAKNSRGESFSEGTEINTTAISTPGGVRNTRAVEISFNKMTITWDTVVDTGGDRAVFYRVVYATVDVSGGGPLGQSQFVDAPTNSAVLTGLSYSTTYQVAVMAATTTGLVGPSSTPITVKTEAPDHGIVVAAEDEVFVKEDKQFVIVPVVRVNGSFGVAEFQYHMVDETAIGGKNYDNSSGTLTLGSSVKRGDIQIPIVNDDVYEANMTFIVVITDAYSHMVTETLVVILDDGDAGYISFTTNSTAVLESEGTLSLTLLREPRTAPAAEVMVELSSLENNRFELLTPDIYFDVGVTVQQVIVQVNNDDEFQLVPDSANLTLSIISGGVLYGTYPFAIITALDDGDVSPPKACTNLQLINTTGGSMSISWTPPDDRGGAVVTLEFIVELKKNGTVVATTTTSATNATVFNLNATTTYSVTVRAKNSNGTGPPETASLFTTAKASKAKPPTKIVLLTASASSLLVSWDAPTDTGGSRIVAYRVVNVLATGQTAPLNNIQCNSPTICSIRGLTALTTYTIRIYAVTALISQGEMSDSVIMQTASPTVPDPPPAPVIVSFTAGAISVQMFESLNVGGSKIRSYRLWMKSPMDADFSVIYEGNSTTYDVYRLARSTMYTFRYQAINAIGPSDFSPLVLQTTMERSLPTAPLNVTMTARTGGAISLAWNEPLDIGGRAISGYAIMIVSPQSSTGDIIGYDGKSDPTLSGTVYGLTYNTTYLLYVYAFTEVSNCFDQSQWFASVVLSLSTTKATPPATPPTLVLLRSTGGLLELQWTEPDDQGGVPMLWYYLYQVSPNGNFVQLYDVSSTGNLGFVHTDLTESTTYVYVVRGRNSIGPSPYSDLLTCTTTAATPPSEPLSVTQLAYNTGGAIQLGWLRPIDAGGQPIKGYWVYRDGALVSPDISANTTTYIDKLGLRQATNYEYTVRAFSMNMLSSDYSDICPAKTTNATRPQKPSITTLTVSSSFISIAWAADPDTGGIDIKQFEAKLLFGSTVISTSAGMSTTNIYTGLVAQRKFTFTLTSSNDIGPSDTLGVFLQTKPVSLPTAPDAPLVVGVYGGNFTVQVSPPFDNGGSDISSIVIYENQQGMVATVPISTGAKFVKYTFLGVKKETDYVVSASAGNGLGEGPRGPTTAIRTAPLNAPGGILTAPVFIVATGNTMTVSWVPPLDTGGDITSLSYEVRLRDAVGNTFSAPSLTLSTKVTGLSYDTVYNVSVRATNGVGAGAFSPALQAKTLPDAAGTFSFTNASLSVVENAKFINIPIQRVSGLSGRITLSFITTPTPGVPATATAYAGINYEITPNSSSTTGTVTFDTLQTRQNLTILIKDDHIYQSPPLQFSVQLLSANGSAIIGNPKTAAVTILDDGDAGNVSFTKPSYSFKENALTATVSLVRTYGSSREITVYLSFIDGTAVVNKNYRKPPKPIIMADGQTLADVTFTIINDKTYQFPANYFVIAIQSIQGGGIIDQGVTTITLTDDGDVSSPGTPPPPTLVSITGGAAVVQMYLPLHNGSASGKLTGYIVRVANAFSTSDYQRPVNTTAMVGRMTALTSYTVSIAAVNSVGAGPFSDGLSITTTDPTLPGPVTNVSVASRTGGSITLSWAPPEDTGGVMITKYRVYMLDSNSQPQIQSENKNGLGKATIYGLVADTQYIFHVQAGNPVTTPEFANGWGVVGPDFPFSTSDPTLPGPSKILDNNYAKPTGGSLTVSWQPPFDTGGIPITSYDIYAQNATSGFFPAKRGVTEPALVANVGELYASNMYQLFVLAQNAIERLPIDGTVTCISGTKVLQTSESQIGKLISGSVLEVLNSVLVVGDMTKASERQVPLYQTYRQMSIVSQSAMLLGYVNTYTNLSTATRSLPAKPPAPTLINSTGGMLQVQLMSPDDTGGIPITDFTIYINGEEADSAKVYQEPSQLTDLMRMSVVSLTRLNPLTSYNISFEAINALSLCDGDYQVPSDEVELSTTDVTPPGKPSVARVRETGSGITVRIVEPMDYGGRNIEEYSLYYMEAGDTVWTEAYVGPKYFVQVAPLQVKTSYQFHATVSNGLYDSDVSDGNSISTTDVSPPGPCDPPTLVKATGGMLNVTWTPPPDTGGANITGYQVNLQSHYDGSGRKSKLVNNTNYYAFYRLDPGSEYDVTVRAQNGRGLGLEGDSAVLKTGPLSAPVGQIQVSVLASTGGAANIAFNEPADLGGYTPEDMSYEVFVDMDNTEILTYADIFGQALLASSGSRRRLATTRRLANAINGIAVGGLDPLNLYSFQIRPVNPTDRGGYSPRFIGATTSATVPSAPRDLTTTGNPSGGAVTLSWSPPADYGGVPLEPYTVYMASNSTGPFIAKASGVMTSLQVTGLESTATYFFYVKAANAKGPSAPTDTLSVSTVSTTPLTVTGKIEVVWVNHDSAELTWRTPKDLGGSSIASYTVTVTNNAKGSTTSSSSTNSIKLTSLAPNTEYAVSVFAINVFGDTSDVSADRVFVTARASGVPSKPHSDCVSSTSASLTWHAYPDAKAYQLSRKSARTGTTTIVYQGENLYALDTSQLEPLETYEYTLAVDTAASGAFSSPSSAETITLLAASHSANAWTCGVNYGSIRVLNYSNNVDYNWTLAASDRNASILLNFTLFDLECDHDYVEVRNVDDDSVVWKGGCLRKGTFLLQASSSVIVHFHSDASASRSGFVMSFDTNVTDVETTIPPPGGSFGVCSSHGQLDPKSPGSCTCSVGFMGEDCSGRMMCCTNPERCHHKACDWKGDVILVCDDFGDDVHGTGAMMNISEVGTVSKAVKTLGKALSLSTPGTMIVLMPGTYKGGENRNLTVEAQNVTISSVKGFNLTAFDCENAAPILRVRDSNCTLVGFTIKNCVSDRGGAVQAIRSNFTMTDGIVRNTKASIEGGALWFDNSKVLVARYSFLNSTAPTGGAVYSTASDMTFSEANISNASAQIGGAIAMVTGSSIAGKMSTVVANTTAHTGGGIYVSGASNISTLQVSNCMAVEGGGIQVADASLQVENCSITQNNASLTGGGIKITGKTNVAIRGSSIADNHAIESGGGMFLNMNGSVTFTMDQPSLISLNTAHDGAGMFITTSRMSLYAGTFSSNNAIDSGGGVSIVRSNVTMELTQVASNVASTGAGVAISDFATLMTTNVLVTNNWAVDGGGVYVADSKVFGNVNVNLTGNEALASGGGLIVHGNSFVQSVLVTKCNASSGGGIAVTNGTSQLDSVAVRDCVAKFGGNGGGSFVSQVNLTVTNVSIMNGVAGSGGGLYAIDSNVEGDLSITNSTASANGGGVYFSGKITLRGISVQGSTALLGGAMCGADAVASIVDSVLVKCNATQGGGGAYVKSSTLDLANVSIARHRSVLTGGGLSLFSTEATHDLVTITNCTAAQGGGAYLSDSSLVGIEDYSISEIRNNSATDSGGNVFMRGKISMTQISISRGFAMTNNGGGVAMSGATGSLESIQIFNNTANKTGGGLMALLKSDAVLQDVNITNNIAFSRGGGIALQSARLTHDSLRITGNKAPDGGACSVSKDGTLVAADVSNPALLANNSVQRNATDFGFGAALFLMAGAKFTGSGLQIQDCRARWGGAICVNSAGITLRDSTVTRSQAILGSAVYFYPSSTGEFVGCTFSNNVATTAGGAITSSGNAQDKSLTRTNKLVMTDCIVEDNVANENAGGINLLATNLTGESTTIRRNIAKYSKGGGIVSTNSLINVSNWRWYDNNVNTSVQSFGAAIYTDSGSDAFINDSDIWSNVNASRVSSGGLVYAIGSASMVISNSRLAYGQASSGGCFMVEMSSITLINSTLAECNAHIFGGGIQADTGVIELFNSTLVGNEAYYDGGGLFLAGSGKLRIVDSEFRENHVEDRGAAIFLVPGAGMNANITRTTFEGQINRGFGSALFIGRRNKVRIAGSHFSGNGQEKTEGGTLYAVDAVVDIVSTNFDSNLATRGGAIEISRATVLTVTNSTISNNVVGTWGGALYASVRSSATFVETSFLNNVAGEGGVLFATGATTLKLSHVHGDNNRASSFGGFASLSGRTEVHIQDSTFYWNKAYTGGVLSVTQNATIDFKQSELVGGYASDFGAGVYVDTQSKTEDNLIMLSDLLFGNNTARAGQDVYWVYNPTYQLTCTRCSGLKKGELLRLGTSATSVRPGWWPITVTSGVSLGWPKANLTRATSANETGGMVATSANETSTSTSVVPLPVLVDGMSNPAIKTLWPTVIVLDFYGQLATTDNQTTCTAAKVNTESDSFMFKPSQPTLVSDGFVTFADSEVLAGTREEPYILDVECKLSTSVTRSIDVPITVLPCNRGYQNLDGICVPCKKGFYSLDGVRCYPCPVGANCEQQDISGSFVGVGVPSRIAGYYLWESRASLQDTDCDPSSWASDDPCLSINASTLAQRIHKCAEKKPQEFDTAWQRKRVFTCLSKMEYYQCDTKESCVKEMSMPIEFIKTSQCKAGYDSVTCATCTPNYYKISNGTCKTCDDPNDPAVARMTHIVAMVPLMFMAVGLIMVFFYFSNDTEKEIMKYANAASKFSIYDTEAASGTLVARAKRFVRERSAQLVTRIRERLRRRKKVLFGIEEPLVPLPPFRAEKFKIVLAFFQIFGGFKKLYEIPWPPAMSKLMDIFSIADFSIVDTTGLECFFEKNYFGSYRYTLIAVLILLLCAGLLLSWGVIRYRVKLASLPRHCVKCGLPVFEMVKRKPKTLVRRSSIISMIRIQRKQEAERLRRRSFYTRVQGQFNTKAETTIDRVRAWWKDTRAGKAVQRVVVWAMLPASSSEHYPMCPTTHRIAADVQGMVVRSNLRLWRARVRLRLNYKTYQNKCIKLFFWVLLLFYPQLSLRVMGMFFCEEVGDAHYMTRDKSLLCYQGRWLAYLPLTLALLVLWVAGVPLLFWVILFLKRRSGVEEKLLLLDNPAYATLKARYMNEMIKSFEKRGIKLDDETLRLQERDLLAEYLRSTKLTEPSMIAQVGFIYHSYQPEFWWFEVWDLGRKLFVNCVIGLLAKSGADRIIAALIVFLIYLTVLLFGQPYKEQSDSALAGITQIQLFVTLFCGLILKLGYVHLEQSLITMLLYIAFVSNICTIAYCVSSVLLERYDMAKKERRRVRQNHRLEVKAAARKMWHLAYGYAITEVYLRDPTIRPMPLHVIMELARRERVQQELEQLGVQLALTSQVELDAASGQEGSTQTPSDDAAAAAKYDTVDLNDDAK